MTVLTHIAEIDDELRPASQMRIELDREAVERYREAFDELPPVRLMYDREANTHWVVDGTHTITAARKLGREEVRAQVATGTYLDAFKAAAHANATHGVPIRNADKRHRVEVALTHPEMSKWSNVRIAEACGVSDMTVSRIRPDVQQSGTSTRTDTLGRQQPARKRKKPAKSAPSSNGHTVPDASTNGPPQSPASTNTTDDAAAEAAPPVEPVVAAKPPTEMSEESPTCPQGHVECVRESEPDPPSPVAMSATTSIVETTGAGAEPDWEAVRRDRVAYVESIIRETFAGLPRDEAGLFLVAVHIIVQELIQESPWIRIESQFS